MEADSDVVNTAVTALNTDVTAGNATVTATTN